MGLARCRWKPAFSDCWRCSFPPNPARAIARTDPAWPLPARGGDGPAVGLAQMPDDGEAEHETAVRASRRRVGLAERLEHGLQEVHGNARAGVGDRDFHRALRATDAHVDGAFLGCELERV